MWLQAKTAILGLLPFVRLCVPGLLEKPQPAVSKTAI
jgi:hypothetical protein